jgi:hypothetical protein
MWVDIFVGLAVAALSGTFGFLVKSRFFVHERYLPVRSRSTEAYGHLSGEWHEYHLTHDPKVGGADLLIHARTRFRVSNESIVTGETVTVVQHRKPLHYRLRGQISAGRLFYTAVCVEDPSDAYCAMFGTLLDDEFVGVITGWDYSQAPYASPIALTRSELGPEEARAVLQRGRPRFLSAGPAVPASGSVPQEP